MTQLPMEQSRNLRIGTVEFVSPDEIKVAIEIDAPESVALNTGTPQPFPRVNGYLLVSVDDGFLVGQVEWITIERSPFPKRRGMQDFGLVDLPYPLRRLRLNPLGTLQKTVDDLFVFNRGAESLPTVGSVVLLPTEPQLRSIITSATEGQVKIGSSPIAGDANVYVDPNRLFGRHLAVLGNTGSGKSCSVAGLIRWSIEEAQRARVDLSEVKEPKQCQMSPPNARFIVLDPNGEYSRAFGDGGSAIKARVFKVGSDVSKSTLKVPLWFWNSAEWCSFMQASTRTQRPLLRRALREVRSGRSGDVESNDEQKKLELRRYLSSRLISIRDAFRLGEIQTDESKFGFRLKAIASDLEIRATEFPDYHIAEIRNVIMQALEETHRSFQKDGETIEYFRAFTEDQIRRVIEAFGESIERLGGIVYHEGPNEDVPLRFSGTDLADHLEILSNQENVQQYLDFLIARIRTFMSDPKMQAIIEDTDGITLPQWLTDYIGDNEAKGGCVSVIDLSLVPTDIVHVVTAVIARMVFEAHQRYVKLKSVALPTVLVMEEAHTFIKRYKDDVDNTEVAAVCCQVFERIAREGRKFGLGLVLSSQRPSELSSTVLSQCNTFLLHRINNDRDQEIVHRLVPDNLRGLLRELPSLPSQNAVLLGWASELPVLVKMNDLPKNQQPRSDDPEFWSIWTGREKREINWDEIAEDWQEGTQDYNMEEKSREEGETDKLTDTNDDEQDDELPF
ncbi:MAG: ATP-binding protein [Gemmatimonadetes bacterium]|nr:ATP-binding protein [Gemmatimonadota bacterium]